MAALHFHYSRVEGLSGTAHGALRTPQSTAAGSAPLLGCGQCPPRRGGWRPAGSLGNNVVGCFADHQPRSRIFLSTPPWPPRHRPGALSPLIWCWREGGKVIPDACGIGSSARRGWRRAVQRRLLPPGGGAEQASGGDAPRGKQVHGSGLRGPPLCARLEGAGKAKENKPKPNQSNRPRALCIRRARLRSGGVPLPRQCRRNPLARAPGEADAFHAQLGCSFFEEHE